MDEYQMSDEESSKYWEAVLETIKLIRGLIQHQEETPDSQKGLLDYLDEIMQKSAAKSGGTSPLSQELGLSFLSRKPSTYWRAVEDTVRTVRDFILWKEENPTNPKTLESFLIDFWTRAESKTQKTSPLAQELGMEFLVTPGRPIPPPISKIPPSPQPVETAPPLHEPKFTIPIEPTSSPPVEKISPVRTIPEPIPEPVVRSKPTSPPQEHSIH